jgi:hypothetical protein
MRHAARSKVQMNQITWRYRSEMTGRGNRPDLWRKIGRVHAGEKRRTACEPIVVRHR